MLVPAKVATAGYGVAARHALAAAATLVHVVDLTGQPDASFDATVYPLALVARNSVAAAGHRVRTTLGASGSPGIPQSALRGGGPWVLATDRGRSVVARLRRDHPSLGDRFSCHLGVKTGANQVFLDPEDVEPELLRWAVRGRDVRPFTARRRVRLLWTHAADGAPLPRLPPRAAAALARLVVPIREHLARVGGRRWTTTEPEPAARALAVRLGRDVREAARRRDALLLSRLEHALAFVAGGHTAGKALLVRRLVEAEARELSGALARLPAPTPRWEAIGVRVTGLVLFERP
jgi:hypothetical protein